MAGATATWDEAESIQAPQSATWDEVDKIIPPTPQATKTVASEDVPLKDKPMPAQPEPMRIRQAFLRSRAPNLTESGIKSANKTAAENAGAAVATEGLGELAAPLIRPALEFGAENVLPAIERGVPYAGRVIKFAEEAPSAIKAAVRGAATGATYGGVTGAFEGHPIRGAMLGGAGGAALGAGAYGLGKFASPDFENVPFAGEAEPPITKAATPISVRRTPGEIAPEHLDQPSGERVKPFPGQGTEELPGGGVLKRPTPLLPPSSQEITFRTDTNGVKWAKIPGVDTEVSVPKSLKGAEAESYAREKLDLQEKFARRRGMTNLGPAIEYAAGTPQLKPNVPLRDQPFHAEAVGADVLVPPQVPPRTGVLPRTPLGSRVAVPVGEEFGPLAKGEGKFPTALTEETGRQMGAPPTAKSEAQMELEKKYPDKAVRQMVHVQGERMVDAIGDDPKLMREVHELTGPDVRQALINSGEDMGQISIGSRKATGNQMSRVEAFNKMLDKGLSPRDIVKLAKQRQ